MKISYHTKASLLKLLKWMNFNIEGSENEKKQSTMENMYNPKTIQFIKYAKSIDDNKSGKIHVKKFRKKKEHKQFFEKNPMFDFFLQILYRAIKYIKKPPEKPENEYFTLADELLNPILNYEMNDKIFEEMTGTIKVDNKEKLIEFFYNNRLIETEKEFIKKAKEKITINDEENVTKLCKQMFLFDWIKDILAVAALSKEAKTAKTEEDFVNVVKIFYEVENKDEIETIKNVYNILHKSAPEKTKEKERLKF